MLVFQKQKTKTKQNRKRGSLNGSHRHTHMYTLAYTENWLLGHQHHIKTDDFFFFFLLIYFGWRNFRKYCRYLLPLQLQNVQSKLYKNKSFSIYLIILRGFTVCIMPQCTSRCKQFKMDYIKTTTTPTKRYKTIHFYINDVIKLLYAKAKYSSTYRAKNHLAILSSVLLASFPI